MIAFALDDLHAAIKARELTDLSLSLDLNPEGLVSEAFRIEVAGKRINIIGGDKVGLMYGVLDLAETISLYGISEIKEIEEKPYLEKRGLKMNIALDGRNPAYSDAGTAAQQNIPVVWDLAFWKDHLDHLARNRYNVFSLWNMHPFPSLVKVPEYPEVALHDVMRADFSTEEWKTFNRKFKPSGANMVTPELEQKLTVVKTISIEEKIEFWRQVMQYAQERGIEFYIITWNTFTWGATGKHGITQDTKNDITKDYVRKSVIALFETYPLLAGIGVTAGEHMKGMKTAEKERWLFETYGRGVMDYLEKEPDRNIRFIHRYWWADLNDIVAEFQPLIDRNVTFDISFKYAKARLYSGTKPTFSDEVFNDELPEGKRMWCNLRNDDIFIMRWANPDYVREYILNLPGRDKSPGFVMGADGYVFGKEFICKHPDTAGKLEIDKHWLNYKLWGRLGYNPQLKNDHFEKAVADRFPAADSRSLFAAWKKSSQIIPLVNRAYWNDWDLLWHVESSGALKKNGQHTIQRMLERSSAMEGSGIVSIKQYIQQAAKGEQVEGMTPLQVADELDELAHQALQELPKYESGSRELKETTDDIRSMALLGMFYADRFRGAVHYGIYQKNKDIKYKEAALKNLGESLDHWKTYAALIAENYKPQLLARVGWVDMVERTKMFEQDIETVRQEK